MRDDTGTGRDIGNISALIIGSTDRERGIERQRELIKTNKRDEWGKNKGFRWICFPYSKLQAKTAAGGVMKCMCVCVCMCLVLLSLHSPNVPAMIDFVIVRTVCWLIWGKMSFKCSLQSKSQKRQKISFWSYLQSLAWCSGVQYIIKYILQSL